jgi:hypothetical protein
MEKIWVDITILFGAALKKQLKRRDRSGVRER